MIAEHQLDAWCSWHEAEAAYARTKFTDKQQVDYFNQGVARGDFSWMSSAVGYFMRAHFRSVLGIENMNNATRLRITQEVGKSGHNHLACAAVGRLTCARAATLREATTQIIQDWREQLTGRAIEPLPLEESSIQHLKESFQRLQLLQDVGNMDGFDAHIATIGLPLAVQFLRLTNEYGLPSPGSSTEDVRLWTPPKKSA